MQQNVPPDHIRKVSLLCQILEVADCGCPIRRIHTGPCDRGNRPHTSTCNAQHRPECADRARADGRCVCIRGCDCPLPAPPDERDCDCPLDLNDRCQHVLTADNLRPFEVLRARYGIGTVEDDLDAAIIGAWGKLLFEHAPDDYREPTGPQEPLVTWSRRGRVAALRSRMRKGRGLRHRLDRFAHMELSQPCLTTNGGTGRKCAQEPAK